MEITVGTRIDPRKLYGIHAEGITDAEVLKLDADHSGLRDYAVVRFTREVSLDGHSYDFDAKFYLHTLTRLGAIIKADADHDRGNDEAAAKWQADADHSPDNPYLPTATYPHSLITAWERGRVVGKAEAAAPDLLAALKLVLRQGTPPEVVEIIQAAVTKALNS